ncbi:hypothetical protein MLD38_011630 [Melastoma candidum]|uniref:Uncharacterized protein n=1 Tax=Melastoma candidum TaxID=119954 RepID=A0ACB9R5E8_9MYRT|nr:hypothetical protein MLD38_011630 [Melastoma candidum]
MLRKRRSESENWDRLERPRRRAPVFDSDPDQSSPPIAYFILVFVHPNVCIRKRQVSGYRNGVPGHHEN